jgi:hypothetical protein
MKGKAAVVLLLELAVRRSELVTYGGSHHHLSSIPYFHLACCLLLLFTFTSIKDWLLIESQ